MAVIFLFGITAVALIGWLCRWVACAALAKYIVDKGYIPPTEEEMKACCTYVWKKILHVHEEGR